MFFKISAVGGGSLMVVKNKLDSFNSKPPYPDDGEILIVIGLMLAIGLVCAWGAYILMRSDRKKSS